MAQVIVHKLLFTSVLLTQGVKTGLSRSKNEVKLYVQTFYSGYGCLHHIYYVKLVCITLQNCFNVLRTELMAQVQVNPQNAKKALQVFNLQYSVICLMLI